MLFWLGWGSWNAGAVRLDKLGRLESNDSLTFSSIFKGALYVQASNVMLIVFLLSLMPQFIDPEIAYVPQVTFMIAVYALMVFVCMIFYALIADRMRVFLARGSGPKLMNKASAVIFMLLACWVLWNTAQPFL